MHHRTIPIQSAPASAAAAAPARPPRLVGDPAQLQRLLAALEEAVCADVRTRLPAATWLRELRVDGDEAVVTLAPGLHCRDVAQVAFETLRGLLHDTDIYVGAAPT